MAAQTLRSSPALLPPGRRREFDPKAIFICAILCLACGCARKDKVVIGSAQHEVLYRAGLDAFRQATPESYGRAIEAFRKASLLSPSHCEYSLHLAESLLFLAKEQRFNWEPYRSGVSEAAAILDAAQSRSDCGTLIALMDRVKALTLSPEFLKDGTKEALALMDRAIAADSTDPMNWVVLNQLRGKPQEDILRADRATPVSALVQYEIANYWLDQGNIVNARLAFEAALKVSPGHFKAMLGLAYCISVNDPDGDPHPLFSRAVDTAPNSLLARLFLGDYYGGIQEPTQAVAQYRAALALRSDYYPALVALGSALIDLNLFDEAEQILNEASSTSRQNIEYPAPTPCEGKCADSQAHNLLGLLYLIRNDLLRAESEYRESLRLANNFDAMFGLGTLLWRTNRTDEALVQFQSALKFEKYLKDSKGESQLADLYAALGSIFAEQSHGVEATTNYDRAIKIYRAQIEELDTQATQSERKGLVRQAQSDRRRKTDMEKRLAETLEAKRKLGN